MEAGSATPYRRRRLRWEPAPGLDAAGSTVDPRDHAACAAIYKPPIYLLLINRTDDAFRPYMSADPCGDPREEIQAALRGLAAPRVTTYTFDEPN